MNDSKATNVAAAAAALESFDGGVHAILGGSLKGGDFVGLAPAVARALPRLLPDRRSRGAARRGSRRRRRRAVPCGDLERAVREAAARARPGDVVLLSPACASFDQYRDFEERGEHFRELVRELS